MSKSQPQWLDEFLKQPSSEYFVKIDKGYLTDAFNTWGLKDKVAHFAEAWALISKGTYKKNLSKEIIEQQAMILYGMIHQRYLQTDTGIDAMHKKYKSGKFAKCPRVYCKMATCLPFGVSDMPGEHTMMLFCPVCNDVYCMKDPTFANVDGAYFGPTYVHMYLQQYRITAKHPKHFVPSIFGFKICDESEVHVNEDQSN